MKSNRIAALSALALVAQPALAQPAGPPASVPVKAPAELDAIPLFGDQTPGNTGTEDWGKMGGQVLMVYNVTRPTLTPFLPNPNKATGAAIVVAPGGAFMALALEHEGWTVARALADRGIAAFVLKYRLVATPHNEADRGPFASTMLKQEIGHPMESGLLRQSKAPDDARAALAMVRANAAKWHIDPARVGIVGFSAGAMTARRIALDSPSAERPAFVGYIYGPQDEEAVPVDAPPLFDAIALDDPLFPSKGFPIAAAWHAANRPVEIHGYQQGSHGFGLGNPGTTNALMLDELVRWLGMNGFLGNRF
jgi:acetyl esterase/lipase